MIRRNGTGMGWLMAGCGIVLTVAGIWRGELREVFLKAATICLECIGLR